jgi:N-acetylmuramoyl-L-alanine amidase
MLTAIFAFCVCDDAIAQHKNFILMIDPGHGGSDAGAVHGRYREKDLNLEVALALGSLINREMPGVDVLYTRTTDVNVDLAVRGDKANSAGADLFLSIHTNAAKNTAAGGTETFVMGMDKSEGNLEVAKRENEVIRYEENYQETYAGFDPNSAEMSIIFGMMQYAHFESSLSFARMVQKSYAAEVPMRDRGAKQGPFMVLWRATMPRVLTEIGFMSNDADRKYIFSEEGKNKIVLSLFYAFREYKAQFDADADNPPMTVSQPAGGVPASDASGIPTTGALSIATPSQDGADNSMRAFVVVDPADIAAADHAAEKAAAEAALAAASATPRLDALIASGRVSRDAEPSRPHQAPETYPTRDRASVYDRPAGGSGVSGSASLGGRPAERAPETSRPTHVPQRATDRASVYDRPASTTPAAARTTPRTSSGRFYVQISATRSKVSTSDARWGAYQGEVTQHYIDGWYKYSIGPFSTREEAAESLERVRRNKFPGAFIVELP